jgi:hypothetical protein
MQTQMQMLRTAKNPAGADDGSNMDCDRALDRGVLAAWRYGVLPMRLHPSPMWRCIWIASGHHTEGAFTGSGAGPS